jgi:hypothetical protein
MKSQFKRIPRLKFLPLSDDPRPQVPDLNSLQSALLDAVSQSRESDLPAIIDSFTSLPSKTCSSLEETASTALWILSSSTNEALIASAVRFLARLFSGATSPLALRVLESGVCENCVKFLNCPAVAVAVIELFRRVSGGEATEADIVESVLPVCEIERMVKDGSELQLSLCKILRNYAIAGRNCIDVFARVWPMVCQEGRLQILWAIYRLRKSLKVRWVGEVVRFGFVELWHSAVVHGNPDVVIAALKCIKEYLKQKGRYENAAEALKRLGSFIEAGTPLQVEIACWGTEIFLGSDRRLVEVLREVDFTRHLIVNLDEGSFDVKRAVVSCLATVIIEDLPGSIGVVRTSEIIPRFLDLVEQDIDRSLVAIVLDFFLKFFRAAQMIGEAEDLRATLVDHGGKKIIDDKSFDDDEEIAQIATAVLMECIDPFTPLEDSWVE